MSETAVLRNVLRVGVGIAFAALLAGCTAGAASTQTASPTATSTPTGGATDAAPDELVGDTLEKGTAFSPLMADVTTTPGPAKMTDGKIHLAYEVLLTNATGLTLHLAEFEVRNAETGEVLLLEDDQTMHTMITPLGTTEGTDEKGPLLIEPTETVVAWMDVVVDDEADVPAAVEHRAAGELEAPDRMIGFETSLGTQPVVDHMAQVVNFPVGEGIWLMSEGCCRDDTHHRRGLAPINGKAMVPQRFAIDFYMLDEEHRTWEGDPSQLTSYFSYQQPILAAAAGTVVRAVDGHPNTESLPEPPPIPPIEATVGNHVVVEIAPGVYTLYGHMDTGSVRVSVGDTVEVGQELGLIGSSGNSTTPHVHFHLQTVPTFFPSDGLPYEFAEFELLGRVTDRIWDDNLGLQPTGVLPFEEFEPSTRTDELPLDRDVVRVP